jgi:hypothetical protein
MAFQTPFHMKGLLAGHQRHGSDLTVARFAGHTAMNVNAVIEVNEVGQVVHACPMDRTVFSKAGAHRFEHGAVGPNLRVAVHAGLCRRNSSERTLLDRRVAISAVDSDSRDMVFMTKRNRLIARDANFRQIWRAYDAAGNPSYPSNNEHSSEDADPRDGVRAPIKDLGHRATSSGTLQTRIREKWSMFKLQLSFVILRCALRADLFLYKAMPARSAHLK